MWLVAALTLAGGLLRFTMLGQSYWYDEAVTVGLLRSSFVSMVRSLPGSESTPPLYYVLAWVWTRVFGTTEVGLRSLSALLGTAAIPVAAAAGRELISKPAGVVTAGLVAVSPFLIFYSQEARAYSLYVLLSALSLLLFVRSWRSPSRRQLALWALVSSLAIWTEYFAGFLVLAEALFLAIRPATRRWAKRPILAVALATLAVLPLVYKQMNNDHNAWIADISLHRRADAAVGSFLGSPPHPWLVAAALAALVAAMVASLRPAIAREAVLIPTALASACLLLPLLFNAIGRDYWLGRNVIDAWVPLALALAAGLASTTAGARYGRAAPLGLALVIVALLAARSTTFVTDPHKRVDWRGLARCLGGLGPASAFIVSPSYNGVVLKLYRRTVRAARDNDRVSELVVIAGDPGSVPVPAGFHPAGTTCSDTVRVRRYRAATRLPVPAPGGDTAVLLGT